MHELRHYFTTMKDGKKAGYESIGFQPVGKERTMVLMVFRSRLRPEAQAEYGDGPTDVKVGKVDAGLQIPQSLCC